MTQGHKGHKDTTSYVVKLVFGKSDTDHQQVHRYISTHIYTAALQYLLTLIFLNLVKMTQGHKVHKYTTFYVVKLVF